MTVRVSASSLARVSGPVNEHAVPFGAQTLLVSAFVVALSTPVFYRQRMTDDLSLEVIYALAGVFLPVFSSLFLWRMQWGSIGMRDAGRLVQGSFFWSIPALLVAVWVVMIGEGRALIGVAVMAFIAALLLAVMCQRMFSGRICAVATVVSGIAAIATPIIILTMTQMLPHGTSVIAGWSIPVPVAAMGAVGAAFALKGCARDRAQESDR